MDINTIVLIVILVVMVYALTDHWKEKNTQAEQNRQKNIAEKEEISKEEIATYGQVQERKNQLLGEIVEDWAELKIEAFQNRRSWVRATPTENVKS